MAELGLPPGPELGRIMKELAERVLDDPDLNTRESLFALARDIHSPAGDRPAADSDRA